MKFSLSNLSLHKNASDINREYFLVFTEQSKKKPVVVIIVAILSSLALLAFIYLLWRCIKRKRGYSKY